MVGRFQVEEGIDSPVAIALVVPGCKAPGPGNRNIEADVRREMEKG